VRARENVKNGEPGRPGRKNRVIEPRREGEGSRQELTRKRADPGRSAQGLAGKNRQTKKSCAEVQGLLGRGGELSRGASG